MLNLFGTMFKHRCPDCKHLFWIVDKKFLPIGERPVWYKYHAQTVEEYCPHCSINLKVTRGAKRLYAIKILILVPAILISLFVDWKGMPGIYKWSALLVLILFTFYEISVPFYSVAIEDSSVDKS